MTNIETVLTIIYTNKGVWIGFLIGLFIGLNYLYLANKKDTVKQIELFLYVIINFMSIGFIMSQLPSTCY